VIVAAAAKLRARSFVLDGEGLILRQDDLSDFDRLHTRRHDDEVQLLGFDLLELDGADLRQEPLEHRKIALVKILRRSTDGIQVKHIEAPGEIAFNEASRLGLERIVRSGAVTMALSHK
jgi:ATP-dependent DNA ligase